MTLLDMLNRGVAATPAMFSGARWRWTRPLTGVPPHADMGFFYCDGAGRDSPDCLQPRPLSRMEIGCVGCARNEWKPFDVWLDEAAGAHLRNAGQKDVLEWIKKDPRVFARSSFYCQHGLRAVARCPSCGKVLDLEDGASPIALVANVNAGKSVYSAVCASELRRRDSGGLFARTGLSCFPRGSAHRLYEAEVVNRLMERGELPRKTWLSEYHKAVYRLEDLSGGGWASRSIVLTDVAGEVYDEAVTPAVTALGTILLWARGVILLVDPCNSGAAGGMGGRQAPDLLDEANRLVTEIVLPTGEIEPPNTGRVLGLLETVSRVLRDVQWPHAEVDAAASHVAAALVSVGITPGISAEHIASVLESTRRDRRRLLTNGELASWLGHHIQTHGNVERTNGRLPYTIAVAVTKSELVESELGPRWRHPIDLGARAGASDWARELGQLSAWSKTRLTSMGLVEREFVETLDEHFANVGYFFVSSLGRNTEFQVRRGGTQTVVDAYDADTERGAAPSSTSGAAPWWVASRVVTEGDDGSRCPRPVGVLHPLLWLLSQGNGRSSSRR